ncbi:Protein TolB [Phycisphaerae bacterium RAS1]|nr:Protein TolB [Phycisphaerae bacterium RAS1]
MSHRPARTFAALASITLGVLLSLAGCPTTPTGNDNTGGGGSNNNGSTGNSNSNSNGNTNTNTNGNDNGATVAPSIDDIPNESIPAGVTYVGPTPSLAAGSAPITWSLDEGPAGMTIDAASGVVTWPEPPAGDAPQLVSIKAANPAGDDSEVWLLTIETVELQAIRRVSVSRTGEQGNQESNGGSISADGSRIAFASRAGNLLTNDANDTFDVFVIDVGPQTVRRCSVRPGGAQTAQASFTPALSGDGAVVVFRSSDPGLVAGDTNNRVDIFAQVLATGATELISRRSASQIGNDASDRPSVSADGRFVAFESLATNLVSGDTNAVSDVFVRDRSGAATTRVSVSVGGSQANGASRAASISADGRYVAFASDASNLVGDDDNGVTDIFVRDRNTGATIRVSLSSTGQETDGACANPHIAGDNGRYIVFESDATNFTSGGTGGRRHIYRHDRTTGETTLVSANRAGNPCNNSAASPRITPDGRYVVFHSRASDLVEGDSNGFFDVFRRDTSDGTTIRISAKSATFQGNNASIAASISDDGRFVTFDSKATNMVDNDLNEFTDVFLRDLAIEIE